MASGNPFEVQTLNPLQALLVGNQAYDASKKSYQQEQQKNVLASLLGGGVNGGNPSGVPDYGRAASTLAAGGDLDGAVKIATLGKAFSPESTPDIQNFNFAVKNGFKGSILDFAKEKAAAGATKISNSTNVTNTGEKEYDKSIGKAQADEFIGIQKAGAKAPGAIANLNEMERLTNDPTFYSGAGGELATKFKRVGVGLGFADSDAARANETFTKLSNAAVLDAAGGSLGTGFSNADRSFLQDANANIQNTPEGNRAVIANARAVQQRNIEVANMARQYAAKNGGRIDAGFYQGLSDWAEKNPLFKNKAATQAQPQQQPQAAPRQAADGNYYVPDPNRPGKYLQVVQ